MTDWIDRLAESAQKQAAGRRTQEELRLHKIKIINAKAPEFWDTVLEKLRTDSAKLRDSFPNDRSRQCDLIKAGIDWQIQGCKLPFHILNMHLNVDGHCIDIDESVRESRDRVVKSAHDQISIAVNSDEELEFRYRGRVHTTPDSLAQHLISYVCDIREFGAV